MRAWNYSNGYHDGSIHADLQRSCAQDACALVLGQVWRRDAFALFGDTNVCLVFIHNLDVAALIVVFL